ncbi:MAG: hypothetical protein ABEJ91_01710 [Candidatus Nanohaloarchaea archaeon]
MTVFEARPVDTETVETTSRKDYNRIVEEHREKTGFYLVADHRRINGTVQITELQPLGAVTVENDRRERVYEATNRILEHTSDEARKEIEEQVDTILSTIGVPDRVINQ